MITVLKTIEITDTFFVKTDNFSKISWTVPLKNKNSQRTKVFFEKISMNSETNPKLTETDRGKEFYNSFFSKWPK